MNTFFVKNSQIENDIVSIFGEDFNHIKNSLRMKNGEDAYICDENANKYFCTLCKFENETVFFQIKRKIENSCESPVNITLYQGLPKQDKFEKVIKESTQLGVSSIVPVATKYSIAKVSKDDEGKKIDRWNKIALEAAKQCGRQKIPVVCNVIKFQNIIENIGKYDIVLLLYEREDDFSIKDAISSAKNKLNCIKNIAIIVGPEGGFSKEEVDMLSSFKNLYICTLGNRILRTELAPIMVLSNLLYEFEL